MPRQLSFDLPVQVALGAADFFVSEANRTAYAMVTDPDSWPQGRLVLTGPKGSGKSHLARVFAATCGAPILAAAALPALSPPPARCIVIEDMEALPRAQEEALFHLCNNLAASGGRLLLTARTPPARWPIALPDLASRLQAITPASVGDPDDRLLAAVLMKHFQDRQLSPSPALLAYLAPRIERSFAAAAAIVAAIDAAALSQGRRIGIGLARSLLDKPDEGAR